MDWASSLIFGAAPKPPQPEPEPEPAAEPEPAEAPPADPDVLFAQILNRIDESTPAMPESPLTQQAPVEAVEEQQQIYEAQAQPQAVFEQPPPAPPETFVPFSAIQQQAPQPFLTPAVPSGAPAWDEMEQRMAALQNALLMEESAKGKLELAPRKTAPLAQPPPQQPYQAAGLDESMHARLAALTAAIEGEDQATMMKAAEEAGKLEARARRMQEREAKRAAKRGQNRAEDEYKAVASAAADEALLKAPVVVEKKKTESGAELVVQLTPSMAAKIKLEQDERSAEERERQRLKQEWEARESARREEEEKIAAEREDVEARRRTAEEAAARRKMEAAAAEAAQVAERERTEAGSAQNIAQALGIDDVVRQLRAAASRATDDPVRLASMLGDDCIDLVCDAMGRHTDDYGVQEAGCGALKALSLGEDRARMRKFCERGLDSVCAALEIHGGNGAFQIAAFGALANLAVHIGNKVSVINVVLAGLAADPQNPQLAEVACCAIKNAALGDDSNRVNAAEAGAIEALLGAMRTHSHVPPVQEQACWAIKNLSVNPANQQKISDDGGIQDVLAAMRALPRSAAVQEQACWALRILAFRPESNQAVAEQGGVQAVLDAMKMHTSHAGVQETCCGTLRTLCVLPESKIEAIEKGCFVRAVAAMRAQISKGSVQVAACGLLASLISNPDTQRRGASAGVIEATVEVLEAQRKSTKVSQACFTVLSSLTAANAENKVRAASAGGVEAAVYALHTHAGLTPLAEACCETLASIVSNEASQISALDAKGIEAILGACRAHPHRPNLQEKGCKAMAAICWCQPPAQRRARETGVLKDIITMMNMHPEHRGVQKQARALMQTIQVEEEDDDFGAGRSGRENTITGMTVRQPNYRYHTF